MAGPAREGVPESNHAGICAGNRELAWADRPEGVVAVHYR